MLRLRLVHKLLDGYLGRAWPSRHDNAPVLAMRADHIGQSVRRPDVIFFTLWHVIIFGDSGPIWYLADHGSCGGPERSHQGLIRGLAAAWFLASPWLPMIPLEHSDARRRPVSKTT